MAIMIPLNRNTFRKFFDCFRPARRAYPAPPSPPPPPVSIGRRLIDSIVIERFTMTPSTSAADGLLDGNSTSSTNSVAITSTDGSVAPPSGLLTASNSAASTNVIIAYNPPEQISRASSVTPDGVRKALHLFKETGVVPKSGAEAGSSSESAAPVHPVLHFSSLSEVAEAASPQLPMAAPPLQQPSSSLYSEQDSPSASEAAGQHESFPPLPLTPIHENAMADELEAAIRLYEVPGDDRYPRSRWFRPVNGSALGAPFEQFTVSGRTFYCPLHLLLQYRFWRILMSLERPVNGWTMAVDPNIFALVMEALVSASGFQGTEEGLNLAYIVQACRQAHDWGMDREVKKLVATYRGYIARRILYRNPHQPDFAGLMDHSYFVYRSEEIYRAWKLLEEGPQPLQRFMPPCELHSLYAVAIPHEMWPALTPNFSESFTDYIDFIASLANPEGVDFEDWWTQAYKSAGLLDFTWIGEEPSYLNFI